MQNEVSLTGYTTYAEEKLLPAIIPVCVEGEILWAYLDTGRIRSQLHIERGGEEVKAKASAPRFPRDPNSEWK